VGWSARLVGSLAERWSEHRPSPPVYGRHVAVGQAGKEGAACSCAGAAMAWAWAGEATLGQTRGGRPGKRQIEFFNLFSIPN